jgi:isoleucyl-tRNA synthetase
MELRDDVLKALEEARNNKVIGKSFNAHLTIYPTPKVAKLLASLSLNLQQVFIVSKCTLADHDITAPSFGSGQILVEALEGYTCSRCWQIVDEVDEDGLCHRCHNIVSK